MGTIWTVMDVLDLHDARYCAAVGIQWLGFKLGGAEHFQPSQVAEILDWVSGPNGIAVFEHETADEISQRFVDSKCSLACIPQGYDLGHLAQLSMPLVIRMEKIDALAMDWMSEALGLVPNTLIYLKHTESELLASQKIHHLAQDESKWILELQSEKLISSSLGKPFAFALDSLVKEDGGHMDYAKCDDFLATQLA